MILQYEQARSALHEVGPKAFKLAELAAATTVPVNPGLVASWSAVAPVFEAVGLDGMLASVRASPQLAEQLSEAAHGRLPSRLLADIPLREACVDLLGLEAHQEVVVRTSALHLPDPRGELEGVGSSRVCTLERAPDALSELVSKLVEPDQLLRLARLGSGEVRIAFLVNPFPHHDVSGMCASYEVLTSALDAFELHLGHGQLFGMTRGLTSPDSYVVDLESGSIRKLELGGGREAVYLDAEGRYVVKELAEGAASEGVADSAGVDVTALLTDFRAWVREIRRRLGRDLFQLEFCIDRGGAVVITDVRYRAGASPTPPRADRP